MTTHQWLIFKITGCSMLTCNFGFDDNHWFQPFQGKLLDWGLFDRWTSTPRQGCEADIDFPPTIERGDLPFSSYLCPHANSPQWLNDLPRLPQSARSSILLP
jgi:hypothetical protein